MIIGAVIAVAKKYCERHAGQINWRGDGLAVGETKVAAWYAGGCIGKLPQYRA